MQSAPQPAYSIAALELLNDVLAQVDGDHGSEEFYSRLAEAVCRLAQMRRAVIFRYDDARRRVHAAGAYGIALDRLTSGEITVESAPVARQALTEDRVIEVLGDRGHEISDDFAELVGEHPVVYVPIVAAGRGARCCRAGSRGAHGRRTRAELQGRPSVVAGPAVAGQELHR